MMQSLNKKFCKNSMSSVNYELSPTALLKVCTRISQRNFVEPTKNVFFNVKFIEKQQIEAKLFHFKFL